MTKPTAREKRAIAYALRLMRTDFYFSLYFRILDPSKMGPEEAFRLLEEEVSAWCGENRYTSYNSFRHGRSRYVNRVVRKRK